MANPAQEARLAVRKVARKLQPSLGAQIDTLHAIREKKRSLESQLAELDAEYKQIEEETLELLSKQSLDKASGKLATVSVSSSTVANVEDWDQFNAYVRKTGYFHLFQRRVTDAAYRELLEQGVKVPGVSPFIKRRLNLRSV